MTDRRHQELAAYRKAFEAHQAEKRLLSEALRRERLEWHIIIHWLVSEALA